MKHQSFFYQNFCQVISSSMTDTLQHNLAKISQDVFLKILPQIRVKLTISDDQTCLEKKLIKYHILLEKNAQLDFEITLLHAQNVEIEIHLYLQGDGSKADVSGLYALSDQQNLKIKTYQMHYGVDTQSSVIFHGMLKDQSKAEVQGLIFIDQKAVKTDASQENKNIVLSPQARVVSVPSIEVLNHDVQCCHGTAIGQFNEQHFWYLQSRGLSRDKVYRMLVTSFFGHVIQKFENKSELMEMVCQKML